MEIRSFSGDVNSTRCDALIVAIDSNWESSPLIGELDKATGGWLRGLLASEEISTKACKTSMHLAPNGLACKVFVTVGLDSKDLSRATVLQRAAAAGMRAVTTKKRGLVRLCGFEGDSLVIRAAVVGAMVGTVGQDLFRKEKSLHEPDVIEWQSVAPEVLKHAVAIGDGVNLTRRLVNLPANYIYPESLAQEAVAIGAKFGIEVDVWDQKRLESERCGSLLAVARGSSYEPRLVILNYRGGSADEAPIALVGKGVTFDSGGYSIKPSDGMMTMKCDMAGAATVLGAMASLAALKAPINVIGVIGLVENMISGNAFRLGDVLTARSGKTIEIHNTDAEGRLVLADCLNVALDYKPSKIIDFATLTGACVVALGNDIAGIMSNSSEWQSTVQRYSEQCGEFVWPLPMHSFFNEQIAGKVADIKNVGEGRWGGAITAAKFLEEFVDGKDWVHLDIAGPAFLDSAKPWCDAGGTGCLVRTMVEMLSDIAAR